MSVCVESMPKDNRMGLSRIVSYSEVVLCWLLSPHRISFHLVNIQHEACGLRVKRDTLCSIPELKHSQDRVSEYEMGDEISV